MALGDKARAEVSEISDDELAKLGLEALNKALTSKGLPAETFESFCADDKSPGAGMRALTFLGILPARERKRANSAA